MFTKKEAPIQGIGGLGGGAFSRLLTSSASGGPTEVASRSLRFDSDNNAHLSRTPSSTGNVDKWTWAGWVKRGGLGFHTDFFSAVQNGQNATIIQFDNNDRLDFENFVGNSDQGRLITDQFFRDTGAWYHITCIYDSGNSTADDRIKLFVNGSQVTAINYRTNPSSGQNSIINSTNAHYVGADKGFNNNYFSGYLADVYFIDDAAVEPVDNFIELDDNGVYQAKVYNGAFGTNGFHLSFSDATSTTTIAEDDSGKNNDFTANNISVSAGSGNDSVFDVPTNGSQSDTGAGGEVSANYATWSPLVAQSSGSITLSNGNLDTTCGSTRTTAMSTFHLKGKTYWEVTFGAGTYNYIGMTEATGFNTVANNNSGIKYTGYKDYSYGWQQTDGKLYKNSNIIASPGTYSNGDVLGWAYDADNNTLKLYKNGSLVHTETGIADAQYFPAITHSDNNATSSANFGQRPFAHAAPSGYKPVSTATSLSTPTIADGSDYFETKLYTSETTISGLSFSPDLVWLKRRSPAADNGIYDTVRGANKLIYPNANNTEETGGGVSAFNSDGFDLGTNALFKGGGYSFVSWNWDAGSSTVSNDDGNFDTNVRANTTAGFSIVQAPSMTIGTKTLGHGLGATPDMIWVKRTSGGTEDWYVYHSAMGTGKQMRLNGTGAEESTTSFGTVNSSVFSYDPNTGDHIAFCFKAVAGYSAFGSYIGNGLNDGTYVHTGFRPAFVFQKRTDSSSDWTIHDSAREPGNDVGLYLVPNANHAEQDGNRRDFLSNGFKLRTSSAGVNADGGTYFWAAFAENPFQSNGGLAF